MIILKKDFKKGFVSLKISSQEDLWYLTNIISPGDQITSKTERKIKIGSSDSSMKVVRKTIVLTLLVEDVSLQEDMSSLRVKGTVVLGPEDVPSGSYHTFGLSIDDSFTLQKKTWISLYKDQLQEAISCSHDSVLFCLFDREKALFSIIKQSGISHLGELDLDLPKKQYLQSSSKSQLFSSLVKTLEQYDAQYSPKNIVCASPDFWKDYVQKQLSDLLLKKTIFISSGDVSKKVVSNLLTRPELTNILANQRLQKEERLKDDVLKNLKEDKLVYGFKDVSLAVASGSVKDLVVTNMFISSSRKNDSYQELNDLLTSVDSCNGYIHIIQDPGVMKIIDGLGGIVAITRWVV
jgi:protein pelota